MGAEESRLSKERERLDAQRIQLELIRQQEELIRLTRIREENERKARLQKETEQLRLKNEAIKKREIHCPVAKVNIYPNINTVAGVSGFSTNMASTSAGNPNHFGFEPSAPLEPINPQSPVRTRFVTSAATSSSASQLPVPSTSATTETLKPAKLSTCALEKKPPNSAKKTFKGKDDGLRFKTCKKPFSDQIYQCRNGHSSCESCRRRRARCGDCGTDITDTRNFDVEKFIAANVSSLATKAIVSKIKCLNSDEGCILWVLKTELAKHLQECPFRERQCPAIETCTWEGKLSQLSRHFDEAHPTSRSANVDTEMFLSNICRDSTIMQLIQLGNYVFLFYVKVSAKDRMIYMTVQLIGTRMSASKWIYEVHVFNKSEPRRKYQYEDTCHSYDEGKEMPLLSCVNLPIEHAMTFYNEGKLTYKVYIKKHVKEEKQ